MFLNDPWIVFFVQLFFFLIVKCVCCYRFLTLFHIQYNRKGTYNILDHLKLVQLYCHITSGIRGDRSGNGQCGCFWNPCWQWKTKIYNLIIHVRSLWAASSSVYKTVFFLAVYFLLSFTNKKYWYYQEPLSIFVQRFMKAPFHLGISSEVQPLCSIK